MMASQVGCAICLQAPHPPPPPRHCSAPDDASLPPSRCLPPLLPPLPPAGNVAWEADDRALTRLFEPCGVIKVRLHTDKDTGKPKGFAHVHFRCAAAVILVVVQLGGLAGVWQALEGARCALQCAMLRQSYPAALLPMSPHCVWAGAMLRHRRHCCCCRDEAGLDQAVALDGTSLLGRRIRVGYAQPKKE